MVRTFYIPENKRKLMMKFVELAEKNGVSYSKLFCQYMEDYVEAHNIKEMENYINQ